MAKEKSTNDILKQVLKRAQNENVHDKIKDKAPEVGNYGALPAGIDGIARLTRITLGNFKTGKYEGEPYALLEGSVVEPEVFNNIHVKGRFTRLGPLALCDTTNSKGETKSFEENYQLFLDHLKILGCDFSNTSAEDVEDHIDELLKEKPYFGFKTSSPPKLTLERKNGKYMVMNGAKVLGTYRTEEEVNKAFPYLHSEPAVFHNWNGLVDYEEEENDSVVVEDVEDDEGDSEGEDNDTVEDTNTKKSSTKDTTNLPDEDIAMLAKLADEDDNDEAQDKLTEIATNLGIPKKSIDKADNWESVAAMIDEKLNDNLGTSDTPEVGQNCTYEEESYEIITVDSDKETVTLRNNNTGKKLIKNKKAVNVPWGDITLE